MLACMPSALEYSSEVLHLGLQIELSDLGEAQVCLRLAGHCLVTPFSVPSQDSPITMTHNRFGSTCSTLSRASNKVEQWG